MRRVLTSAVVGGGGWGEVWGSENGGPLSIAILYGTPHSSSREIAWYSRLEKNGFI